MSFWQNLHSGRLLADVSLWWADLTRFGEEMARIDPYADLYHIDVSDAHFAPSLPLFPDLVAALRPVTQKKFHGHLMVDKPQSLIDVFAGAGADMISIQIGNEPMVRDCLDRIGKAKCTASLAVNVDEDPSLVVPSIDSIEVVVILCTASGVKRQPISQDAYSRRGMKSTIARSLSSQAYESLPMGGFVLIRFRSFAPLEQTSPLRTPWLSRAKTIRWIRSL